MGITTETRVDNLEHGGERDRRGPVLVWIDGADPRAEDPPPGAPMPRMFKTRAGADRWLEEHLPTLDPVGEGKVSVVFIDENGDASPAEMRAKLKENTRRIQEHEEALARQQRETREELYHRRQE